MNDEKETCYFLAPGKLNKCSILNEQCTGTRSRQLCSFHKTEKEFFEARNRAVEINRAHGKCARCKYSNRPCEIITIGGEDNAAL
ncbi:MAG: hypothetical protein IJK30_11330 [Ruminococcus sp.]|nr:hypothetical protein [Ruminococcus sp.]